MLADLPQARLRLRHRNIALCDSGLRLVGVELNQRLSGTDLLPFGDGDLLDGSEDLGADAHAMRRFDAAAGDDRLDEVTLHHYADRHLRTEQRARAEPADQGDYADGDPQRRAMPAERSHELQRRRSTQCDLRTHGRGRA